MSYKNFPNINIYSNELKNILKNDDLEGFIKFQGICIL